MIRKAIEMSQREEEARNAESLGSKPVAPEHKSIPLY